MSWKHGVLILLGVILGVAAWRPLHPIAVSAQKDSSDFYIEPGVTTIRSPDGSFSGPGKMVVNLRTGEIWGFPTGVTSGPYPIDTTTSSKTPTSSPIYLGRFDFSAMHR